VRAGGIALFERPALDAGVACDFRSDASGADDLELRVSFSRYCEIDAWELRREVCFV
jgi:hypothetical protein